VRSLPGRSLPHAQSQRRRILTKRKPPPGRDRRGWCGTGDFTHFTVGIVTDNTRLPFSMKISTLLGLSKCFFLLFSQSWVDFSRIVHLLAHPDDTPDNGIAERRRQRTPSPSLFLFVFSASFQSCLDETLCERSRSPLQLSDGIYANYWNFPPIFWPLSFCVQSLPTDC